MKQPYRLVAGRVSDDTVRALEELLSDARAGRLIGIAFAAMYEQRKYIVETTGEATRSPTFCRGMVAMLDDYIGRKASRRR